MWEPLRFPALALELTKPAHSLARMRVVPDCLPCHSLLLARLSRPPAYPAPVQITDKDAEVLSYCTDVRCERFHGEDDAEEVRWGMQGAEVDRHIECV